MTQSDMEVLARQVAGVYDLPPELVCAVVEQESGWNPWATRFEPGFYERYIAPLWDAGKIATRTEAQGRAFSWGLMQVMGEVAREFGFVGPFLPELCEPATGLDVGCKVLAHKVEAAAGDMRKALLLWNGGGNPSYPDEVLARVGRYQAAQLPR